MVEFPPILRGDAEAMWTVLVTDQNGQVVSQHEWKEGSLTIGREPGRSIVLNSRTASRRHARLDLVGGTAVVVDEGSANGTFVNGARIAAPTRIDASSRVEVGEFRLVLQPAEDDSEKTVLMGRRDTAQLPVTPPPRPSMPPPPRPAMPGAAPTPPPRPPAPAAAPVPPPPRPAAPAMPVQPPRPAAPPPAAAVPPVRPATPPPTMQGPAVAPSFPAPSFPASPPVVSGPGMPVGADITSSFERHLQSVRSYREEAQSTTVNKRARIDEEWGKLVQNMRALQTRLSSDKRVLSFTISRDLREVALKLADAREKRGHRYFLLSRHHPEGKFPGVENVWLREFGRDDASYDDPQKALEELMLRVAGTLA